MLQYPSILSWRKCPIGMPCLAFTKYDGSNLRFEYSPKKGWHKFGTRHHLFDKSDETYAPSIDIFQQNIGDVLLERVKFEYGKKVERITAFTEFFGPSSFAGVHVIDEPKELKLFDVFVFKKGFIPPKKFYNMFNDLPFAAEMLYEGNMNKQFINDVRLGKITNKEGVVCKGNDWASKIKTQSWLNELRNRHPNLFKSENQEQNDIN